MAVADASVGGEPRANLRRGQRLLSREPVTRARELLVLGTRAQTGLRAACVDDPVDQIRQQQRIRFAERLARQRIQPLECGTAARLQVVEVLLTLQQRRLDGGRIRRQRCSLLHARIGFLQTRVQFRDGRGERTGAGLESGGGEKRVVHLLPQRKERRADARLVFRELRPLDGTLGANRRIEQSLIDADAGVVGVLRRLERSAERRAGRQVCDVGLLLRLTIEHHGR